MLEINVKKSSGIPAGVVLAVGTRALKRDIWNREMASATLFFDPSICTALNCILFIIVSNTNGRISCIICLSFDDLLFTILTNAILKRIFLFFRFSAHKYMASTTGTNSKNDMFLIICKSFHVSSHRNWTHDPWKNAPQPKFGFPELSVKSCKISLDVQIFSGKKHWPLKFSRNFNNMAISDFTSIFNLILWNGFLAYPIKS